jgi:hypothetical protein
MTTSAVTFDDFQDFPHRTNSSDGTSTPPKEKKQMVSNTMVIPYRRYLDLKRTGRVRGGDPQATASEPAIYTDENGIEWVLSVSTPSTAGPNLNVGSVREPILNRHARRAAKARARRATK